MNAHDDRSDGSPRAGRRPLPGFVGLAALVLALLSTTTTAHAQSALRAVDGGTEHRLFIAGRVGVYLVAPVGTPASGATACVIDVPDQGEPGPSVLSELLLSESPRLRCSPALLPRVERSSSGEPVALLVPRGGGAVRLPTERDVAMSLVLPNPAAAWRAAASIAAAVGRCGFTGYDDSHTDLICDVGLRISTSASGRRVDLQLDQGVEQRGTCEAFVDAYGFEEALVDATTQVCTRGELLGEWTSREDLAAALGPCSTWPGDPRDLRCGRFRVEIDVRGRLAGVRLPR